MNFTSCTDATFPQNRNLEPPLELGRTKSSAQAAERLDMDLPAASRLVSSLEKESGSRDPWIEKETGADRHEIAGTVFRSRPHMPISASAENRRSPSSTKTRLSRSGFESELAGEYRSQCLLECVFKF